MTRANIKNIANKLCDTLSREGFEGIDIYVQKESIDEWDKDYAIFILEFDIDSMLNEQCPYLHFDEDKLYADFRSYLQNAFELDATPIKGRKSSIVNDVKIVHHRACSEWEVYRD